MPVTCGIDVGTSGIRAVVVGDDGRVLGSGAATLSSQRVSGRHEQVPADWWDALCRATRDAVASSHGAEVDAVALDSTSGTLVALDSSGQAQGPALMYDDSRGAAFAEEADSVGRTTWVALGHAIAPSWALPRLLWLLRGGHLAEGGKVVHQGDHLAGLLVGHPVPTDTSQALKTGVDLRTATWPVEVFEQLGIPERVLPEVVLPGTALGVVSAAAASSTGLPAGATVRAGMTDGCAAQVATGALALGSWSSALGTTLVLKGATSSLVHDPAGAVYSHRHPDGGWLPGGASTSGAGVLRTLLPGADLDGLTVQLQDRLPDHAQAVYPVVDAGERFPLLSDEAPRTAALPDDDLDRFASLCLGIACVERLAYDTLGALGADVSGEVAMSGGATRNGWLNQLRVDLLGRPAVLPETHEAAFGAAVLAAAPPGRLTETARRMVRVRTRLQPDRQRGAELAPLYETFVRRLVEGGWLAPERAPRPAVGSSPGGSAVPGRSS